VLADFIPQTDPILQKKFGFASAAWHPDGKRITFWIGDQSPSPIFWTVPIAGGPGIKIDIPPAVEKELAQASGDLKAGQQWGDYPFSWSPSGDAIYFVRGYRGAKNIWKLKVDPETMRATAIERLTTGPGPDEGIAISRDGKQLAFTAMTQRIQVWLFPFDAGTGRIKGNGTAVTAPGRTAAEPVLSRDGTKVAYFVPLGESFGTTQLNVHNEIWVKSLVDGSEAPVIADDYSRWYQAWSPDGRQLAYVRRNDTTKQWQVMIWSIQSRKEQPLPDLGGIPACWDWSPDGKWLLLGAMSGTISLLPVALAPHAVVHDVTLDKDLAAQFHFSPDGRWIVFNGLTSSPIVESAIYVVPTSGGASLRITDGRHWDDKPRWSPDGRTIYFVSKPGGFFNVWGVHFDPLAGKPVGQPFQVSHFDRPRLMIPRFMPPVGMSLTQDKLVLTMEQESGNIWILDNVDR
jgi:Tol biopolymer transport system component